MGKSIQFQGRETLVAGFKNTKATGWSVWDGRDMLTKGIGSDMLDTFLDALEEGSTNTIYTLRIYEDIDDSKKIKMGTDPDGSFKFILEGDPDQITHPVYSQRNNSNKLFDRLKTLEDNQAILINKIAGVDDDDQEEEEPQTIGAMFVDIIKNPPKLKEFVESIHMVRSLFQSGSAQSQIPASIGNIPAATMNEIPFDEKIRRAQVAINTLEANDEKFLEHMETLASIAKNNKPQFDILLTMLDNMK